MCAIAIALVNIPLTDNGKVANSQILGYLNAIRKDVVTREELISNVEK